MMETVELIVFIGIAILVGGLVVSFVAGINPKEIFDSLSKMVFGERELTYKKVNAEDLALNAYKAWEKCGFGINSLNLTLYFEKGNNINRSTLFKIYKKLNLCYSIQSGNETCGTREDVSIDGDITGVNNILPPGVVTVSCDVANKMLTIQSR